MKQESAAASFRNPYQRCADYVPGLRSAAWWEASQIPLATRLEAAYEAIKAEFFDIVLSGSLRLHPQVRGGVGRHIADSDWGIFALSTGGLVEEDNALEVPYTAAFLRRFIEDLGHPMGLAYFSVLRPGAHVRAHSGPTNTRIRLHLGIRVPDQTEMRVGTETRTWREGRCSVFDDSWDHEVFNRGHQSRSVLVVDVWHPDLTSEQRSEIVRTHIGPTASRFQRKGWHRRVDKADGLFCLRDLLETMGTIGRDRLSSVAKTAGNIVNASDNCSQAAIFILELLRTEQSRLESARLHDTGLLMTNDGSILRSLGALLHGQFASQLGGDDSVNLVHILSLVWRSNPTNYMRMNEFLENWSLVDRSLFLDHLAAKGTFCSMVDALCNEPDLLSGVIPFGSVAALLVTALRRTSG